MVPVAVRLRIWVVELCSIGFWTSLFSSTLRVAANVGFWWEQKGEMGRGKEDDELGQFLPPPWKQTEALEKEDTTEVKIATMRVFFFIILWLKLSPEYMES